MNMGENNQLGAGDYKEQKNRHGQEVKQQRLCEESQLPK